MTIRFVTLAAASVLAFSATAAQAGDSAAEFVNKASVAGEFEVQSSKLALERSQDADVKAFAQKMIDDHSKANNELKSLLEGGTIQPSASLDEKHQEKMEKLTKADAEDFDDEYLAIQKDAHDEAVDLFEDYSKDGEDAKLKEFATKTLPTLQAHKDHVKELKKDK